MKRMLGVAALLTLALSSCASAPTQQEISSADYGSPITQDAAVALATSYMQATAKDPYSLHVDCGTVHKGWTQNRISKSSFVAGYILDCSVNGKNSFGAYVGTRGYRFVIRDGQVVKLLEQMSNGGYGPASAVDSMRDVGIL